MRNKLYKIKFTAIAVNFALSTAFAASIPGNCSDEIIALSKGSGFDMQSFMSSLPTAVAKAKLQAKAPFGKPKDSDKTDVGMTFGCLKVFPESPTEITSLLKDIGQKIVSGTAAAAISQVQPQYAQPQAQALAQPQYAQPQAQALAQPQYAQPQAQAQAQPQYAQPQYAQPQYAQPQYAQPQYAQPQAQAQAQSQYAQPQAQAQPQYPPTGQHQYQQAQVSQSPPPQGQHQYPPPPVQPQYPPPQVYYIYLPQQVQQTQCQQVYPNYNFSTGQRLGTWFLNTIFPGLGSAVVMSDYVGMGIQMGLTGLGIITIGALGFENYDRCYGYSSGGGCYSYESGSEPTGFFAFGVTLVATSAIYNIYRSITYDKPEENYASNKLNGFNLAVLPNRHGEIMPYMTYNKTF